MISAPPDAPPLEIYLLGLVDFEDVQQLQRRLVYDLGDRGGASLVLCEHPPTISVGRSGSRLHINADDAQLRALGIKVHWVNRGGGCVLHLPGQLAAYLALPLAPPRLNLQRYLDRLHAAIVGGARRIRPAGDLPPGHAGCVPGQGAGRERRRGGQPLDRLPRADGERRAVPELVRADRSTGPGLTPAGGRCSGRRRWRRGGSGPHRCRKVRETLIRQIEAVFGLERHHVYTDHPLIRRKVCAHVYAQSPG